MYAYDNGIGWVDKMHFRYNDAVHGEPQLCDDNSRALNVLEIQYFESDDAFKYSDF